jgi:hypothetical protein
VSEVTVHIAEAKTRYAKPLCRSSSRATTYKPGVDELVWILAKAKPPARVQLGGTGFTVPVVLMDSVEVQRGKAVVPCAACKKALAGMCDRLGAQE